jgi:hypothetical protein
VLEIVQEISSIGEDESFSQHAIKKDITEPTVEALIWSAPSPKVQWHLSLQGLGNLKILKSKSRIRLYLLLLPVNIMSIHQPVQLYKRRS